MNRVSAANFVSGVVVVARRGKPIISRAYSYRDRRKGKRITLQTRFASASVGKIFTAAAVARLVEKGTLSYEAKLGAFIPDYPFASARDATIGQLLSHTAGLGRSPIDWIAGRKRVKLADLVCLTAAEPRGAPGGDPDYSNESYLVAGRIMEIASGKPYEKFLRDEVFLPAGLVATSFDGSDDTAIPYSNYRITDSGQVFVPGPRRDVTSLQGVRGTPAGGIYTTAYDLLAFANALMGHRLLSSSGTDALLAPRTSPGPGGRYAYGFLINGAGTVATKGGNAQGVSAEIDIAIDGTYTVIVLSNYDQAAQVVASEIRRMVGF